MVFNGTFSTNRLCCAIGVNNNNNNNNNEYDVSQCRTAVRTLSVVRVTQQVDGKWQFCGCQNSVTLNRLTKYLTRDYLGDLTSYAKFNKIWWDRGLPATW